MSQGSVDPRTKEEIQTVQGGPSTWSNPTGRVSVQFAPGAVRALDWFTLGIVMNASSIIDLTLTPHLLHVRVVSGMYKTLVLLEYSHRLTGSKGSRA